MSTRHAECVRHIKDWKQILNNVKYRAIAIVVVILVCIYGIIGNRAISHPTSKSSHHNWKNNIRLGLDLKGGSQLMLQVQLQDAFKAEADGVMQRLKDELREGQHHLSSR